MSNRQWTWIILALGLALGGCSGGSDGGNESGKPATSGSRGSTVNVTVRDVFGAPVAGVQVAVMSHMGPPRQLPAPVTDAAGKAQVPGIPEGPFVLEAYTSTSYGISSTGVANGRSKIDLDMVMHPASQDAGGVVRAWVPEGGVSADGRTLEIKLQLSDVPGKTRIYAYYSDWADEDGDPMTSVSIASCEPSPANDAVVHHPDCVVGPDGFDAPYAGTPDPLARDLRRLDEPTPFWSPLFDPQLVPFRTVLLVEQSALAATDDSGDQRLLAARYFLNYAGSGRFSALLGAFADDDPTGSSGLSLLPQKPLAVFPLENPGFTADGRSYFPTVEGLRAMEGGSSPLFAAVSRAIDLQVAAGGSEPRSVVVITDGSLDSTCGSRASCRAARDAVIEKSRTTGVAIVVVGFGGSSPPDWESLGLLGQGAPGSATFWAGDPAALAPTLRTVRKYLGQLKRTTVATYRIESTTPGAFASGRTVLGRVSYGGWNDFGVEIVPATVIPFAVRIP